MAKWFYFVLLFYQGDLEKHLDIFIVANDQRPAADSELIIVCLINLDMINISIESFKLVLNEIIHIENKNYFIIIIIRRCIS